MSSFDHSDCTLRFENVLSEVDRLIWDEFERDHVGPAELDELWSEGWRHFGTRFFRYNVTVHEDRMVLVTPLRVDLKRFRFSPSQRRNLRKNREKFRLEIGSSDYGSDERSLFAEHATRFTENRPERLSDFLGTRPGTEPTPGIGFRVFDADNLIAVSFTDEGDTAFSSIYAMYDLSYKSQGLGIYTMLEEIDLSLQLGKAYYYHGYAYIVPSPYDYKKRLHGLEAYYWDSGWKRESRK